MRNARLWEQTAKNTPVAPPQEETWAPSPQIPQIEAPKLATRAPISTRQTGVWHAVAPTVKPVP